MKLILITLLIFSYAFASAQFMSVPSTSTIRTPYGNVSHTTYTNMPMYYGSGIVSAKHKFTIILKNDSTLTANTKIDMSAKTQGVYVKAKGKKKKIEPVDTKEIYRMTAEGKKLSGMPVDSCWLFQTAKGKINTYSNLAEVGTMYAIAIQEGDNGPIKPLTKSNLMFIVGDVPKLRKLVERGKLIKAIDFYNANAY
jgi:hypothetical protein